VGYFSSNKEDQIKMMKGFQQMYLSPQRYDQSQATKVLREERNIEE